MRENDYQSQLIKDIYKRWPEAFVFKNDPNYMQGVPDLIVLVGKRWAMLEVKRAPKSPHQPNQDYYVDLMNKMSFAAFIFPENQEEVLDEMERSLQPRRKARISWGK